MKIFTYLFLFLIMMLPVQAQVLSGDSIPVRLNSLDAQRVNNNNHLNWKVTCFLEYAGFDIQRSADGISYSTIHTFQADKARCLEPFNYVDQHNSDKSFYRVRVGDLDGKFYTSKIVAVFGKTEGLEILFPGIVNSNSFPLIIASALAGKVIIRIYSFQGYYSFQQQITVRKGHTSIPMSLFSLTRGAYIITVTNASGTVATTRFIKQ